MSFPDPWSDPWRDTDAAFLKRDGGRRRLPGGRGLRALLGLGTLAVAGLLFVAPSGEPLEEPIVLPALDVPPAELVEHLSLGEGETLGEVLTAAALSANEQEVLLLAFREQASPRRMRVGTEISLRRRPEDQWLRGVDVALNPDETVRLTRDRLGWHSALVRTPVAVDTVFAGGTIRDVLWNAIVDNPDLAGLPVEDRAKLIHHLDQIFQWQVDFYRQIQQGDTYRFAFERQVRPDGSMRGGHVIAAELVNQGEPYHAVWFDPNDDGYGSYFDLEGESVRRAFLLRPIQFSRISSRFSRSRYHPILRRWRAHRGVDFAAGYGTPVEATGDGVVTHRGRLGGLGNAVVIRHPRGFVTRYGHLRSFAPGLNVGDRVRQGELVGHVGSTGLATGPHVHYEMIRHGSHIDPMAIDLPAGDPVPVEAWDRWLAARDARLALLGLPVAPVLAGSAGNVDRRADEDDDF